MSEALTTIFWMIFGFGLWWGYSLARIAEASAKQAAALERLIQMIESTRRQ